MKYSIWCYLFGHIWIKRYYKDGTGSNGVPWGFTQHYSEILNNCNRCGLSKEEVGITHSN